MDHYSFILNGSVVGEYSYDGQGRRVKKPASGVVTLYHYDYAGNLIAETDGNGTPLRDYVYLNGERIAKKVYGSQAGWYYFLNDHLGTPQKIADSSGEVVWEAAYLPFGEAQIVTETVENNFRFPGQYYDAESGLHYNWNRYYDPQTGRYLTPDTIGLDGGVNLYAYVEGNPIIWNDPMGLEVGSSGFVEGFIPIWGSARDAVNDFQEGNYVWATVNTAMAVTDIFLVKAAATAVGKGAFKLGSHTWKMTRVWYGKTRNLPKGTHVHHWLVPQRVLKKFGDVGKMIGNQPWNLLPMFPKKGLTMKQFHDAVEGKGEYAFGLIGRLIYGTPNWTKALIVAITGDALNASREDDRCQPE